jgi:hypothetical protein
LLSLSSRRSFFSLSQVEPKLELMFLSSFQLSESLSFTFVLILIHILFI